jgi:hypothetical protein
MVGICPPNSCVRCFYGSHHPCDAGTNDMLGEAAELEPAASSPVLWSHHACTTLVCEARYPTELRRFQQLSVSGFCRIRRVKI